MSSMPPCKQVEGTESCNEPSIQFGLCPEHLGDGYRTFYGLPKQEPGLTSQGSNNSLEIPNEERCVEVEADPASS